MSIYPRECEACHRLYADKRTFHQHHARKTCERTVAKNAAAVNVDDNNNPQINNNNTQINNNNNTQINNNNSNNTINVTNNNVININIHVIKDVEALEAKLGVDLKSHLLKAKDLEAVSRYNALLEDEQIENKEHLAIFVEKHQQTIDELLASKEDPASFPQVLLDIISMVEKADSPLIVGTTPYKDNGRDIHPTLLHLGELLWKHYILPKLDNDILEKVVKRPVRVDSADKQVCQTLRNTPTRLDSDERVDPKDNTVIGFRSFCEKYRFGTPPETAMVVYDEDNAEEGELLDTLLHKFRTHCRKYARWTREDMYNFIRETLRRICELICDVLEASEITPDDDDIPTSLQQQLGAFRESIERRTPFIPMTTLKRIETCLLEDSRHDYMKGWRVIDEALNKRVSRRRRMNTLDADAKAAKKKKEIEEMHRLAAERIQFRKDNPLPPPLLMIDEA